MGGSEISSSLLCQVDSEASSSFLCRADTEASSSFLSHDEPGSSVTEFSRVFDKLLLRRQKKSAPASTNKAPSAAPIAMPTFAPVDIPLYGITLAAKEAVAVLPMGVCFVLEG